MRGGKESGNEVQHDQLSFSDDTLKSVSKSIEEGKNTIYLLSSKSERNRDNETPNKLFISSISR